MISIEIPRPIDFHVHLRHSNLLDKVLFSTTELCSAAMIMPNLPSIDNAEDLCNYRSSIDRLSNYHNTPGFHPLMTIQIKESTTPKIIKEAREAGAIAGKIYPKSITTASSQGLSKEILSDFPDNLLDSFKEMSDLGMILSLHPEMPETYFLYREVEFLSVVNTLATKFPKLKIVLEHISSKEGINYVLTHPTVACTITPQHLLYNTDKVLGPPLDYKPYCLPIYKTPEDLEVLRKVVVLNHPRVFMGTDTAPHEDNIKLSSGCGGVFIPTKIALAIYTSIFHSANMLANIANFTSIFGSLWYNLDINTESSKKVLLENKSWKVPSDINSIPTLCRNEELSWSASLIS